MKHLYFVRHGSSELNEAGLFAGRSETPLTALGRQQAVAAGDTARALGIDLIVSSPLSRARHTAEIIAQAIGYDLERIVIEGLFIERDFGSLERQTWRPLLPQEQIAGMEPLADLLQRGRRGADFLASLPANNILVVSHGSLGRALRHHFRPDFPFDHPDRLQNAQIVQWL